MSRDEELTVGSYVEVVAGDFTGVRGEVARIDGKSADVRFVIFGRDAGTHQFETAILQKVSSIDPPIIE